MDIEIRPIVTEKANAYSVLNTEAILLTEGSVELINENF